MIRYSLRCERGHQFESWFQDSASFDRQVRRKLVACPNCDSTKVKKAIMAPQVTRKGRSAHQRAREERLDSVTPQGPVASAAAQASAALMTPEASELRAKLKELRDYIRTSADNVGEQFPEQARKMHYGEIKPRAIYGEASPDEARALVEEGVDVLPVPLLPDDRN